MCPTNPKPSTELAPIVHQALPLLPTLDEDSYATFLNNIKNALNELENLQVEIAIPFNTIKRLKINNETFNIIFKNTVYMKKYNIDFIIPNVNNEKGVNFIIMTKNDFNTIVNQLKEKKIIEYFGKENIDYSFLTIPNSLFEICFAWSIPTSFLNVIMFKDSFFFQGKRQLTNYFKSDKISDVQKDFFLLEISKYILKTSNANEFFLNDGNTNFFVFSLQPFFLKDVNDDKVKEFKNEVDKILKKIHHGVETVICQEDFLLVFLKIDILKLTAAFNEGQELYVYLISQLINDEKKNDFKNSINLLLISFDDWAHFKDDENKTHFGVLKLNAGDSISYFENKDGTNVVKSYNLTCNIYYYSSFKYNFKSIRLNSPCLIMNNDDQRFFSKNDFFNNTERNFPINEDIWHVHDFNALKFFDLTRWIFNRFKNEDYCYEYEKNKILQINADSTKVMVSNFQVILKVKKNTTKDLLKNTSIFVVKYQDINSNSHKYIAFPKTFQNIVANIEFLKRVDNITPPEYIVTENVVIITYNYKIFLKKIQNDVDYYNTLKNNLDTNFNTYLNACRNFSS